MYRNIVPFRSKSPRQRDPGFARPIDIKNVVAGVTIKMAVFLHVRAKARRAALQTHLPHHSAFNQRVQAIINGGHRNIRQLALGPDKHFLGGGMIPFLQQDIVHPLPLRRKAKPAISQPLIQIALGFVLCIPAHYVQTLAILPGLVNIWNNSN
jgi:hypothetical protein